MSSCRLDSPRPVARTHEVWWRQWLTGLLALSLVSACATTPEGPESLAFDSHPTTLRQDRRSSVRRAQQPSRGELGPIEPTLVDTDYFFGLLVRVGVPPSEIPKDRRQLAPDDAARLLNTVLAAEVPLKDFGPWRMAAHLLVEVVEGEAPVPRKLLHEWRKEWGRPSSTTSWASSHWCSTLSTA